MKDFFEDENAPAFIAAVALFAALISGAI